MSVPTAALSTGVAIRQGSLWKRRALLIILMSAIAGVFWVNSRYPALFKRYHAGTHIKATGALTFSTVYSVDPSMPYLERVWRTTANWLDANRVGMTFAFLFAPAALTFLGTLRRCRTHSRFLNVLLGTAAGVPLGVCANCVAPIARGFYASGMSTESVLAAMFASPALNVVVLTMTFALFPVSLALLKLATVLFLILVFVPFVSAREKGRDFVGSLTIELPESETWNEVLRKTGRSYARAFWQVFRVAFPLLVLAAILGSFAVELIPQQALFGPTSVAGIVVVAAISAFLPVPMAFDVAIAYILMIRGVPLSYVAVILCTLGIISVYSLSVAGKTISWRIAGATYAAVVILGVIAGIATRSLG